MFYRSDIIDPENSLFPSWNNQIMRRLMVTIFYHDFCLNLICVLKYE